jgi:L-alanine-DL-glutamate epimerase-like enolase superfamily enzyme
MPLAGGFRPAWARGRVQNNLILVVTEVDTDNGITGVGAAHGGQEVAVAIERFVAPYFIGQDPTRIELLASILRDAEILGPPVYFMEIPLWDIVGKISGLPVYKFWGGYSDRVIAYCATAEIRTPEKRMDDLRKLIAEGFRAVKLRFHSEDPRDDLKLIEKIRSAIGDQIAIMVDANQAGVEPGLGGHHCWGFQRAFEVARELEQMQVVWLEEPLARHDYNGLARLRDRLNTLKIAGGEDNHGLHEFKLLLDRGCYDVLQPDVLLSEGIFQVRKISALAEAAHLEVAPHTWGNGIGLLANLHLAASIPNCPYFEFPHDPPSGFTLTTRDQMLREPLAIDTNGQVRVPAAPGFGFMLDEDRIAYHTVASYG